MKTPHDLVSAAKAQITEVSLAQAEAACSKAAVIIDVREPAEYAAIFKGLCHYLAGCWSSKLLISLLSMVPILILYFIAKPVAAPHCQRSH